MQAVAGSSRLWLDLGAGLRGCRRVVSIGDARRASLRGTFDDNRGGESTVSDLDIFSGRPVYLLPFDRGHIPATLRWFHTDEEVLRYLTWQGPMNTATTEEGWFQAMQASSSDYVFAVIEAESGRHVGNTGLHDIDPADRRGEVGIYLAPEGRGRGYGQAGADQALDLGLRHHEPPPGLAPCLGLQRAGDHHLRAAGIRARGYAAPGALLPGHGTGTPRSTASWPTSSGRRGAAGARRGRASPVRSRAAPPPRRRSGGAGR